MAEMLITVAIIAVLAGVVFIAVAQHQRSLAQLERDGIAKEIFVAAQNHLTMAENEGYLGSADFGTQEDAEKGIYYFAVNGGSGFTADDASVLDMMLPFGAIDETVRVGGSYIVRYQASPALVLDVFYCSAPGTRYGHNLAADSYTSVLSLGVPGKSKFAFRVFGARFQNDGSGSVHGHLNGQHDLIALPGPF